MMKEGQGKIKEGLSYFCLLVIERQKSGWYEGERGAASTLVRRVMEEVNGFWGMKRGIEGEFVLWWLQKLYISTWEEHR